MRVFVGCVCSPPCHLSPIPHFFPPYFVLMLSAFSPCDLERKILENISFYTAELQMFVILTVLLPSWIQHLMLGSVLLGFHCFYFQSFFLQLLLGPNG